VFQKNRILLSLCMLLLLAGAIPFAVSVFEKNSKLRVAVIDGASSNNFSFYIRKTSYEKRNKQAAVHSNIIWSVLSNNIDTSKIDFFEYSVIGTDGQIDITTFTKALKQAEKDNIDIINFSGGFYLEDEQAKEQIQILLRKGVIIVAAGGNNYQGIADFPARIPGVISVGSKKGSNISSFSAIDKIDIFENGEEILYNNKKYSGTSFATPKVTNQILKMYFQTKNLKKIKNSILKKGS